MSPSLFTLNQTPVYRKANYRNGVLQMRRGQPAHAFAYNRAIRSCGRTDAGSPGLGWVDTWRLHVMHAGPFSGSRMASRRYARGAARRRINRQVLLVVGGLLRCSRDVRKMPQRPRVASDTSTLCRSFGHCSKASTSCRPIPVPREGSITSTL